MKWVRLGTMAAMFAMPMAGQLVSVDAEALPISTAQRAELEHAVRAGQWLKAEAELFGYVRESPESAVLRRALAATHFRNQRYLAAAAEYGRAARIAALDPGSRFALAAAYVALDRRHWARRELEALAAEYPRNPLYPHWLAGIYQHYQWFDRAIEEANKAIAIQPAFSLAHDRLGQCLEALGKSSEALAAYSRAEQLEADAEEPSAWPSYHVGSLLRQNGKLDEALAALERAVRMDPKHAEVQYERGAVLERLGRIEEARAAVEKAVRLEPGRAKFHYALARLQRRLGDINGARGSLETFRRLSR
jgi:tetratricopeptide (TPR) repeat protein